MTTDTAAQPNLTSWLLAIFAAGLLGLGAWTGATLSGIKEELPLVRYRLGQMETALIDMTKLARDVQSQTSAYRQETLEFNRKIDMRLTQIERDTGDSHDTTN